MRSCRRRGCHEPMEGTGRWYCSTECRVANRLLKRRHYADPTAVALIVLAEAHPGHGKLWAYARERLDA